MSSAQPDRASSDEGISATRAEVIADCATGAVTTRFLSPDGTVVVEFDLHPEIAREYALNLTQASIEVEEHRRT